MKKAFLTSGIILCMAAQTAYADLGSSATSASCVESTLGVDDGAASFEAKWKPAISGQIALDSKIYKNSSDTSGTAASTAAAPTPLYSAYDYSMYKTAQPTDANYTTTNKITAITTAPVKAGYVFEGFYTTKQYAESLASGTKVINTNKSFTSDATKQVTSPNGTATWYARWSPFISDAITLNSSMYKQSGASAVSATTAATPATVYSAYDYAIYNTQPTSSNYTASTNKITAVTAPTLTGYTFDGFYTTQQYVNAAVSGTRTTHSDGEFTDNGKKQRTSSGASTWYARWTPNISNAITLNNKIYATTSTTDANAITPTTAGTTTAYSAYDYALYSSKPTSSTYLTATQLSTITKPAMTGYTFLGYCSTKQPLDLTANGANCVNSGTLMINGSGTPQTAGKQKITANNGTDTWFARWRANQYLVTYAKGQAGNHVEGDGNTYITGTAPEAENATFGTEYMMKQNGDLAAPGYDFAGWESQINLATGQTPSNPPMVYAEDEAVLYNYPAEITLTAHWVAQEYEITLNINTSNHGNSAGSPTKLYTRFDSGAYTNSARTTLMTTSANGLTSAPTGKSYTLTLNTNVPSGHTDSQVTASSGTKVASKSLAMAYKGFYSSATGGTQYIDKTNKRITASGSARAASITANEIWYAQYECSSYTPYTAALTGYTFNGWYDTAAHANAGGSTGLQGNQCITAAKTIYAGWSPKTYTVTYNPCTNGKHTGSAVTSSSNIVTYDANFTPQTWKSSSPVNMSSWGNIDAGYHFAGWIQNNTANTLRAAGTAFKYTEDKALALTASCQANVTHLAFTCGTGEGITGAPSFANYDAIYDSNLTYPESTCTGKVGYTPAGTWNCGVSGYTAKTAGSTDEPWSYTGEHDGNLTCEMNWEGVLRTITLDKNASNHGETDSTPTTLYARYADGAYLTEANRTAKTNKMTASANGITTNAAGNSYKLTMNPNLPSGHAVSEISGSEGYLAYKNLSMSFKGFYSAQTGGTQYMGTNKRLTASGVTRSAEIAEDGETWYAQYQCSSYTPYTPTLTGYTFNGWYDTVANANTGGSTGLQGNQCITAAKTIYASWTPHVSGAITIDSKLWKSADDSYVVGTNAAPATVYSRYEEGIYDTSAHASAGGSEGKLETLTTKPAKTGYTFAGIYNQKQILHTAASGTNVVNTTGNGTFTANAAKVVSASGGTSTWYTRWLPVISGTITLDSKVYDTAGTNATTNSSPTTVYSAFDYSMYSGSYTKPTTGTEATLYYNAPSSNCTSGTPCKIASVTAPTATGYTFAGFYTTKITAGSSTSGKTKVINADGTFTADATIQRGNTSEVTWYAYYTKNQHTVSYDCGTKPSGASGSISGSAPSVTTNNATYNTSFTLSSTANTCALAGWNFDGWSCEYKLTDGTHTATSYTAGQSVTFKVDNDVLCHAKWKAKETTITLNKNNGNTNADPATLYTRYDSGAYLDSGYTKLMTTSANGLTTIPTGNTYTFTMAKNASSVGHEDEEVTITSTTSTTPAATFKGFYNSATGSTQYIDANGKITTNCTNKAKTLTSAGTWYAQFNCATATAYTPSLTGYTFDGWYTAATGGTKKTSYCLTANTTYYAHWVAKTTTVAYNCGQTNANVSSTWTRPSGWSADTQTATYDAAFSHPASSACSTPAGYTFNSWCCVAGTTPATTGCLSGNGISSGNWNNTSANVICTAKWTPKNISLNYEANGGNVNGRPGGSAWSNTDGASTCVYDATFNLPTAPKKQGHKFCGWCTGSNCPGTCPAN